MEAGSPTRKVVLLGDAGVGKSSVLGRFANGSVSEKYVATLGVDYSLKSVALASGAAVRLGITDTAGEEKFRSLRATYVRGCAVAVVVYDVSKRASFESVRYWFEFLKTNAGPPAAAVLVGNKTDLGGTRAIGTAEGAALAVELGAAFAETSASAGTGVAELFALVARESVRAGVEAPMTAIDLGDPPPPADEKRSHCC